MTHALRSILRKPFIPPVYLLFLGILAYGIYLPWVGFYWDDWPWIWRYHTYGPDAIRAIDHAFRPLAGIVLQAGAGLAGESPLGWQIYNFVIRWVGSITFWWSLRQIWPKRQAAAIWGAALFLLYPGFSQQYVSVNSSRHLLPLVTFTLSIGFTGRAYHLKGRYWANTFLAILLSLFTMFTTEYYYGLELVRVLILGARVHTRYAGKRPVLLGVLRGWIPYLVPLVGVYAWRFAISGQVNYRINLVDLLAHAPLKTISEIIEISLEDLLEVSIGAIGRVFKLPKPELFGIRKTILYWGLVFISGMGTFIYCSLAKIDPENRPRSVQTMALGVFALWISGLPFWSTSLEVKLAFPNDRLTLPMMVGFSLVVIAALELSRPQILARLVLSLLVGLAVGGHFQNAVSYQRDWETTRAFFQQLTWRAPGLNPGTALLTPQLPILYSTDNSLTAPLNWIYADSQPAEGLPYGLFFLDLRLGTKVSSLTAGAPIKLNFGKDSFSGSTSQAILLRYDPPACLRVLDPVYDRYLPGMPEIMDEAIQFSNTSMIQALPGPPASLPEQIFGSDTGTAEKWCYYYQKADLARQIKDWQQVALLGEIAFTLADSPNHASERVPFIEGYAHTGSWETAIELTMDAIEINKFMGPMLCATWQRILQDVPEAEIPLNAIARVEARLSCSLTP